jgi:hypothetical protein
VRTFGREAFWTRKCRKAGPPPPRGAAKRAPFADKLMAFPRESGAFSGVRLPPPAPPQASRYLCLFVAEGAFLADFFESRRRCENLFSRSALSREKEARPRASRAGPGGVTSLAVALSVGRGASVDDRVSGGRRGGSEMVTGSAASSRNGTSDVGGVTPSEAGVGWRGALEGSGRETVVNGTSATFRPGIPGSGMGGPPEAVDSSGGPLLPPIARFRDSQMFFFSREEPSRGATSRGCGRPKRRSGATPELYARRRGSCDPEARASRSRARTP